MTSDEAFDQGLSDFTGPAPHADERTMLLQFLQRQRGLIAWKMHDAADSVLQAPRTPTGMTLPGLVRHLTNAERWWIRNVFAGEEGVSFDWTEADPDAEWKVPTDTSMADLLRLYSEETERGDAVVAAAPSLDAIAANEDVSLRWILMHLIEETARHLGHADLLREQADGTTGEEPA